MHKGERGEAEQSFNDQKDNRWSDRELINRWIVGRPTGQLKKDIAEMQLDNGQANAYLGYCYVEHVFGIRCKVIALCSVGEDKKLKILVNLQDALKFWTLLYDLLKGATILNDEQVQSLGLPQIPSMMQDYVHDGYENLRKRKDLDPFRAQGCFDDVQVILGGENLQVPPEKVWVRLEEITENENIFRGKLLNQPYADLGVNEGDSINVVLFKEKGESMLISIVNWQS